MQTSFCTMRLWHLFCHLVIFILFTFVPVENLTREAQPFNHVTFTRNLNPEFAPRSFPDAFHLQLFAKDVHHNDDKDDFTTKEKSEAVFVRLVNNETDTRNDARHKRQSSEGKPNIPDQEPSTLSFESLSEDLPLIFDTKAFNDKHLTTDQLPSSMDTTQSSLMQLRQTLKPSVFDGRKKQSLYHVTDEGYQDLQAQMSRAESLLTQMTPAQRKVLTDDTFLTFTLKLEKHARVLQIEQNIHAEGVDYKVRVSDPNIESLEILAMWYFKDGKYLVHLKEANIPKLVNLPEMNDETRIVILGQKEDMAEVIEIQRIKDQKKAAKMLEKPKEKPKMSPAREKKKAEKKAISQKKRDAVQKLDKLLHDMQVADQNFENGATEINLIKKEIELVQQDSTKPQKESDIEVDILTNKLQVREAKQQLRQQFKQATTDLHAEQQTLTNELAKPKKDEKIIQAVEEKIKKFEKTQADLDIQLADGCGRRRKRNAMSCSFSLSPRKKYKPSLDKQLRKIDKTRQFNEEFGFSKTSLGNNPTVGDDINLSPATKNVRKKIRGEFESIDVVKRNVKSGRFNDLNVLANAPNNVKVGPQTMKSNLKNLQTDLGPGFKKFSKGLLRQSVSMYIPVRDLIKSIMQRDVQGMSTSGGMMGIGLTSNVLTKIAEKNLLGPTMTTVFKKTGKFLGTALSYVGFAMNMYGIYKSAQCVSQRSENKNLCGWRNTACQDENDICGGRDNVFDIVKSTISIALNAIETAFPPAKPITDVIDLILDFFAEIYQAYIKVSNFGNYIKLTDKEIVVETLRVTTQFLDMSDYLLNLKKQQDANTRSLQGMANFMKNQSLYWAFIVPAYDIKNNYPDNFVDLRDSAWQLRWQPRWLPNPQQETEGKKRYNFGHYNFFCRPHNESLTDEEKLVTPRHFSYNCHQALGYRSSPVDILGANNLLSTLFALEGGQDEAYGTLNGPNYFVIEDGAKKFEGGPHSDIFFVNGNCTGLLDGGGGGGVDRLEVSNNVVGDIKIISTGQAQCPEGQAQYLYINQMETAVCSVEAISGRKGEADIINPACHNTFVDGQGGSHATEDVIIIEPSVCEFKLTTKIHFSTKVVNSARGNFVYILAIEKPFGMTMPALPATLQIVDSESSTLVESEKDEKMSKHRIVLEKMPRDIQFHCSFSIPSTETNQMEHTLEIYDTIYDTLNFTLFYKIKRMTPSWPDMTIQTQDGAEILFDRTNPKYPTLCGDEENIIFKFTLTSNKSFDDEDPLPSTYGSHSHQNVFLINGRYRRVVGGLKKDMFFIGQNTSYPLILDGGRGSQGNLIVLDDLFLSGQKLGINLVTRTIQILPNAPETKEIDVINLTGDFSQIFGRTGGTEICTVGCSTRYIDLKGHKRSDESAEGDTIVIDGALCSADDLTLVLYSGSLVLVNGGASGQFVYQISKQKTDSEPKTMNDDPPVNNFRRKRSQFDSDLTTIKINGNQLGSSPTSALHRIIIDEDFSSVSISPLNSDSKIESRDKSFYIQSQVSSLNLVVQMDEDASKLYGGLSSEGQLNFQIFTKDMVEIGLTRELTPFFKFLLNYQPDSKLKENSNNVEVIEGSPKFSNTFYINGTYKTVRGGSSSDTFVILNKAKVDTLDGRNVLNSRNKNLTESPMMAGLDEDVLILDEENAGKSVIHMNPTNAILNFVDEESGTELRHFELIGNFRHIVGRESAQDNVTVSCMTKSLNLKGSELSLFSDVIFIPENTQACPYNLFIAQTNSDTLTILNGAQYGTFNYQVENVHGLFSVLSVPVTDTIEHQFTISAKFKEIQKINVYLDQSVIEIELNNGQLALFTIQEMESYQKLLEIFQNPEILQIDKLIFENNKPLQNNSKNPQQLAEQDLELLNIINEETIPVKESNQLKSESRSARVKRDSESDGTNPNIDDKIFNEAVKIFPTIMTSDYYVIHTNHVGGVTVTQSLPLEALKINSNYVNGDVGAINKFLNEHVELVNNLGVSLMTSVVNSDGSLSQMIHIGGDDEMDQFMNHPNVPSHLVGNAGGDGNIFTVYPTSNEAPVYVYLNTLEYSRILLDGIDTVNQNNGPLEIKNLLDLTNFFQNDVEPIQYSGDDQIHQTAHNFKLSIPKVTQVGHNLVMTVKYQKTKSARDFKEEKGEAQVEMTEQTIVFVDGLLDFNKLCVKLYAGIYKFKVRQKNQFAEHKWKLELQDQLPMTEEKLPDEMPEDEDGRPKRSVQSESSKGKMVGYEGMGEIIILTHDDLIEYQQLGVPFTLNHQNVKFDLTRDVYRNGINDLVITNEFSESSHLSDDPAKKVSIVLMDIKKAMTTQGFDLTLKMNNGTKLVIDSKNFGRLTKSLKEAKREKEAKKWGNGGNSWFYPVPIPDKPILPIPGYAHVGGLNCGNMVYSPFSYFTWNLCQFGPPKVPYY